MPEGNRQQQAPLFLFIDRILSEEHTEITGSNVKAKYKYNIKQNNQKNVWAIFFLHIALLFYQGIQ